jgi:aminoglycoside phosphotransferase (APT) family kinase protein
MQFTNEWLSEYLNHKSGGQRRVEIVDCIRFPRGTSRETWFVTLRDPNRSPDPFSLVFRLDLPAGSIIPTSLRREFTIYDTLAKTSVPVAKPLWYEDDPRWIGTDREFYVREHVQGDWNVPHFTDPDPQYDELRIAISKEHLGKLALVHKVDWRALGMDRIMSAPRDEADCGRHAVRVLRETFDGIREEPIAIVIEACEWLLDRAPGGSRISLCKGTNGLGEEIFRGRAIVALSDWEEASLGDPAKDFAFMQNFVPEIDRNGCNLWGLEKAIDYYNGASGSRVTVEQVNFYRSFHALSTVVLAHNAGRAAVRHSYAHIRQCWTGTEVLHVMKRVLAASLGLMDAPPMSRFLELNETIV